jgi:hypothetical protein
LVGCPSQGTTNLRQQKSHLKVVRFEFDRPFEEIGRMFKLPLREAGAAKPVQVKGPFHVAFDLQGRVLVSNANSNTVTRFPANDPGKAEHLTVGYSPHAIAIDSQGNAWVANTLGEPSTRGKAGAAPHRASEQIGKQAGAFRRRRGEVHRARPHHRGISRRQREHDKPGRHAVARPAV